MKKIKRFGFGYVLAGLVLIGATAYSARAQTQVIETPSWTKQNGGESGAQCPGAWYGYAKMTNSQGQFWISPPTNNSSCTFTDASGFAQPYVSVTCVVRKSDSATWCQTNWVTFPVTNTDKYSMTIYVKNPVPPPTTNQLFNLQATWQ